MAPDAELIRRRAEIRAVAEELIARHGLGMKVVSAEQVPRRGSAERIAVICYLAPGRVDFRALLPDLARALHTRIELRQVSGREAASAVSGIGQCGLEFCCVVRGLDAATCRLRAARPQDLPPHSGATTGPCGRLLCCVAYEAVTPQGQDE